MTSITVWLAAAALMLAIVALIVAVMTSRKHTELLERQQQRLLMLTEALGALQNTPPQPEKEDNQAQLQPLHEALEQLRAQQQALHQQQQQFASTIKQLEQQEPEVKLYQRAAKLVEQGASVDDLMQACDLPRAEAELMLAMHQRS
jgi:predicted PurR-regulated permease PerM